MTLPVDVVTRIAARGMGARSRALATRLSSPSGRLIVAIDGDATVAFRNRVASWAAAASRELRGRHSWLNEERADLGGAMTQEIPL